MAVSTLQRVEGLLSTAQRNRLSIVALTLDPERDSLGELRKFHSSRGIASTRWILGRPSVSGVEQLSAAMGASYRVFDDGTVDHQSVFVLLGKSGKVLARSSNTRDVDPRFFGALQSALAAN
jgi:protein SCO1/2